MYYQRLDIPIAQILLNSYPYQRDLLEYLFNTFLEKDACNMARYYGNLLINTIQYNLDPMNQVHYSENVFIEVYPTINSIIEYYYNKYIDNCCE